MWLSHSCVQESCIFFHPRQWGKESWVMGAEPCHRLMGAQGSSFLTKVGAREKLHLSERRHRPQAARAMPHRSDPSRTFRRTVLVLLWSKIEQQTIQESLLLFSSQSQIWTKLPLSHSVSVLFTFIREPSWPFLMKRDPTLVQQIINSISALNCFYPLCYPWCGSHFSHPCGQWVVTTFPVAISEIPSCSEGVHSKMMGLIGLVLIHCFSSWDFFLA